MIPSDKAAPSRQSALQAVKTLLSYIGEDPDRPGLQDTPNRVLKAWEQDWGSGYKQANPESMVKLFEQEGEYGLPAGKHYDQMVIVDGIGLFSTCEHHMAPFFGSAVLAYIPDQRGLLGISKLARVVEHYARRLQVQERLTAQIADFLSHNVSKDCGVVIRARHMCMISRGVRQPHAKTTTSALRGAFFANGKARAEFLSLAARGNSFSCD
jgi:GTP cyclohydrolase I